MQNHLVPIHFQPLPFSPSKPNKQKPQGHRGLSGSNTQHLGFRFAGQLCRHPNPEKSWTPSLPLLPNEVCAFPSQGVLMKMAKITSSVRINQGFAPQTPESDQTGVCNPHNNPVCQKPCFAPPAILFSSRRCLINQ